jgi:hypothetical protein
MPGENKPEPRIILFIQDHAGNHNFEEECFMRDVAKAEFERIRKAGGYWTKDGDDDIFVPWHCVDYARIKEKR